MNNTNKQTYYSIIYLIILYIRSNCAVNLSIVWKFYTHMHMPVEGELKWRNLKLRVQHSVLLNWSLLEISIVQKSTLNTWQSSQLEVICTVCKVIRSDLWDASKTSEDKLICLQTSRMRRGEPAPWKSEGLSFERSTKYRQLHRNVEETEGWWSPFKFQNGTTNCETRASLLSWSLVPKTENTRPEGKMTLVH